jgi:ATP-binding cassette subfamily F protein 3
VVLAVENLAYGPPGLTLHRGIGFSLKAGERLGIIGPNGSGKSTLLWALASAFDSGIALRKKVEIREGAVRLGHNVAAGYTDQTLEDLDPGKSMIEAVRDIRGELPDDACREYLGKFQFHNEHTGRRVGSLSGGEKARLALARLLLLPRNLLILDEPTNHLDIPSREILETALQHFAGTVVLVSHDRTFLERVTTHTLALDAGEHDLYYGPYHHWLERKAREEKPAAPRRRPAPAAPVPDEPAPAVSPDRDRRPKSVGHAARKAAQRERERLERRHRIAEEGIRAQEAELKAIAQKMASLPSTEWNKLVDMEKWRSRVQAEIDRLTAEWVESGEALEALAGSSGEEG